MKRVVFAALFSTSVLAAEPALKPAQEEGKAKAEARLEKPLQTLNEKCGTSVAVKTDYENFDGALWKTKAHFAWCPEVVSALAAMCADRPAYKKALSSNFKAISCLFSGVVAREPKEGNAQFALRNMSFENGVLTFHLHPEQANIGESTRKVVEKGLNQ
jgi:hypothetical protein